MSTPPATESRAERLARRATAVGAGFLVLLPVWQLGVRLAGQVLEPPLAPVVAMAAAVTISVSAALALATSLLRRDRSRRSPQD